MKTYKAYKVLRKMHNGELVSCCSNPYFPLSFVTTYKINDVVKPKLVGSKLFAFLDFNDAKKFAYALTTNFFPRNFPNIVIYECEGVGLSKSAKAQSFMYFEHTEGAFRNYWSAFNKAKKSKKPAPNGYPIMQHNYKSTVSFDTIKIIKEIDY